MRRHSILYLLLALTGCAVRSVDVFHPLPNSGMDAKRYETFQNLYVIIEKPENLKTAALTHTLSEKITQGGGHVAFRIPTPDSPDIFLDKIKPTGLLRLKITSTNVVKEQAGSRIETTIENGKKIQKQIITYSYTAVTQAQTELTHTQTKETLFKAPLMSQFSEKRDENHVLNNYFFENLQETALKGLGWQVAHSIFPVSLQKHTRPVFHEKNQPAWMNKFNEAVDLERRGRYAAALEHYKAARSIVVESTGTPTIPWDNITASIEIILSQSSTTLFTDAWFSKRFAVLPFSDETTSVDAPDLARGAVASLLTSRGYNLIPLTKMDDVLKTKGVSEGGQLNAFKNEKLAEWLEADYLLFGNIEEFNEVNIAVYTKRIVSGELILWDAKTKTQIWSSKKTVSNQFFVTDKNKILTNFLSGLAQSWFEHASNKPLAAETAEFARETLDSLPFR